MHVILFVLATSPLVLGMQILGGSKDAISVIEGFILLLISAVLISGAAIVGSVNIMRKKFEEEAKAARKERQANEAEVQRLAKERDDAQRGIAEQQAKLKGDSAERIHTTYGY